MSFDPRVIRDMFIWFFTIVTALAVSAIGATLVIGSVEIPPRIRDGVVLLALAVLLIRSVENGKGK